MKHIIIVGDGMADEPLKELNGKTPLQAAKTPFFDLLASKGQTGLAKTNPEGMPPGSDITNMSILGYDPKKYYKGRGPFEAASQGIELKSEDVAFRCNLVTIKNDTMIDFTAGHITTDEAKTLMGELDQNLGEENVWFYPGVSYRNLVIIKYGPLEVKCIPPHDITDKKINSYLPQGEGSQRIKDIMQKAAPILINHPINKKRLEENKNPANHIWIWGQGQKPSLPPFKELYGLDGAIITAVDLLKGIGKYADLEVINVPGATGFIDTNYLGKAKAALDFLKKGNFVFVHIEAPDEAGHMGDIKLKIQAIEDVDEKIVGPIYNQLKNSHEDFRILILPDHPTPISIKTHKASPVPFILYGSGIKPDNTSKYSETDVNQENFIDPGHTLINLLKQ